MTVYIPDEDVEILRIQLNSCLDYTSEAINEVISHAPDGGGDFTEFIDDIQGLLRERGDILRLLTYLPRRDD